MLEAVGGVVCAEGAGGPPRFGRTGAVVFVDAGVCVAVEASGLAVLVLVAG